jgi:hypothetical protein
MVILSNTGERVDFNLVRNAGFARTFTHKTNGVATNITGYTFAAQIRTTAGALVASFTITTVNAAQGTFSVALSAAQTSALTAGTTYLWSLEQTASSLTSELLRGYVQVVLDEVTA